MVASRPGASGRAWSGRAARTATWSPTAPRESRARSRTGRCCATTPTRWWRGCSSPRSRWAPSRRSSLCKASFDPRARGGHPRGAGDAAGRDLRGLHGHDRRRPRGVPLRRGEGAARGDRGQAATPAAAPALRARPVRDRAADGLAGDGRPAGPPWAARLQPDAREQRRDAGATSRTCSPAAPTGSAPSAPRGRRARRCARWSATWHAPARRRGRDGHAAAAGARRGRRGSGATGRDQGRASPAWPTRCSRSPTSTRP